MKIGLVGWGIETQSVYKYYGSGHDYLICSEHIREDFPKESDLVHVQTLPLRRDKGDVGKTADLSYLVGVDKCDIIVISPTARRNIEKYFAGKPDVLAKVTTAQHIFFENSPTKQIIGVTGTKGKSTVTTLIFLMLEKCGQHVFVGGNIGSNALDFIHELKDDSWVVLELSSYQLDQFPYAPLIAVHLMMAEEHIDWHGSMEAYVEAKSHLVKNQTAEDITIFDAENHYAKLNVQKSGGTLIPFSAHPGAVVENGAICIEDHKIIAVKDVGLKGKHNILNACAAVTTVWQITQNVEAIRSVLSTFRGLKHHMELIKTYKATRFYDDSVATVPDAALGAINTIEGKKLLLIGGQDRGLDINRFVSELVSEKTVKYLVVFGEMKKRLVPLLQKTRFKDNMVVSAGTNMLEVVENLPENINTFDAVVLSPGFPSYDMYLKYTFRGNEFTSAIKARYL